MATRKKAALPARELRLIAKALADPRRFEILRHIAAQEEGLACADLLASFDITPPTMSHHLKELETAGLIEATRAGKFMNVRFLRPRWEAYLGELSKF